VTHLQADNDDGAAAIYRKSFEHVWTSAKPYETGSNTIIR